MLLPAHKHPGIFICVYYECIKELEIDWDVNYVAEEKKVEEKLKEIFNAFMSVL